MMVVAALPRRAASVLALLTFCLLVYIARELTYRESWRNLPLESIGLGEHKSQPVTPIIGPDGYPEEQINGATGEVEPVDPSEGDSRGSKSSSSSGSSKSNKNNKKPLTKTRPFSPGSVKPVGSTYSKMLIITSTKNEDTDWINEHFGPDSGVSASVYKADDADAALHPPKNKGHEVMIYLTYIIDHYDELADVNIFLHSHQFAWHNNELLDHDAVQMIGRLSAERVQREGYMNMRCHWQPGCPDWMHPGTVKEDINKQEETMLAKSWSELFPMDAIPAVLAQPCCAQFALSRERILALPRAKYVYYRDWLLRTPLSDYISGRVWEYIWHYLFTGLNVYCPKEHVCYCDGFGVCFGGEEEYQHYWDKSNDMHHLEDELKDWKTKAEAVQRANEEGRPDETLELDIPEYGKDVRLERQIEELRKWLDEERQAAKERGDVAMNRAKEAGRPWKDGDGF